MPYEKCKDCGGDGRVNSGPPFYLILVCDSPGCENGRVWVEPAATEIRSFPDAADGAPLHANIHEDGYAHLRNSGEKFQE